MAFSFIVYLLLKPSSPKGLMPSKTVEYLVIFILVLVFYPLTVPHHTCGGRVSKRALVCSSMGGNTQALKMFKLDNGVYPSTKEGLKALILNPDVLKYPNYAPTAYLEHFPKDPWGTEIVYVKTKDGFELISYGADKKEGGKDEYADIFYSRCKKWNGSIWVFFPRLYNQKPLKNTAIIKPVESVDVDWFPRLSHSINEPVWELNC